MARAQTFGSQSRGFQELAQIVDEVIACFSLTGGAAESGVCDKKVRAAAMTVDQLSGVALGFNSAMWEL